MKTNELYADSFRTLGEDFSRFARLTKFCEQSECEFDALVGEAGRLAWQAATSGWLSPTLRQKVNDAEACWEKIHAGDKPDLCRHIYDVRFETRSTMWPNLDTDESIVDDVPGMRRFAIKDVSNSRTEEAHQSRASDAQCGDTEPAYIQKLFFTDFVNLAQYKFWWLCVVPELRAEGDGGLSMTGVLEDDAIASFEYAWPENIVEPIDPHGLHKRLSAGERLGFIRERAKAYSDACRVLAAKLSAKQNEAFHSDGEITLEEAASTYYKDADIRSIVPTKAAFRSRLHEACKKGTIKSRRLGRNRLLERDSVKSYLLDLKNEANDDDDKRVKAGRSAHQNG